MLPTIQINAYNNTTANNYMEQSLNCMSMLPIEKLKYSIHAWSSHSASYHPKNIMVNKPQDQSSRWSSNSNNHMQYITIKLDKMSIVKTITFGKYYKVHVCNLKEFKVYGGLTPNNMIELLHSGLKNDCETETFTLKYKSNDIVFPCLYIKIVPLVAWGTNFNFSIWYVELKGHSQQHIVEKVYQKYVDYRENEVIRLCLKHFRQRCYLDTFNSLQNLTNIKLEDQLLTDLHTNLVFNGDFDTTEKILYRASEKNLFDDYIKECQCKTLWKRIYATDKDGNSPYMRGGHQMCIDSELGKIYMFGGWDGSKNLADFWEYDENTEKWTCISKDTSKDGGPSPRSCHRIAFDTINKQIYMLGYFIESENNDSNMESDFWKYDINSHRWIKLSSNTAAKGGPGLIYDHQMVIEPKSQIIYVFGGRTQARNISEDSYSGLYSYSIKEDKWRLLRSDSNQPENSVKLKSRIGHSMLLNPETNELYIFAGKRNKVFDNEREKNYLSDFYIYRIDDDYVIEVSRNYTMQGGPDAGFEQRATMDIELGELYMLSGLLNEKNSNVDTVKNILWMYNIKKKKWTKIYQNVNYGSEDNNRISDKEPCTRFASQLVYDTKRKVHFLFGGNPGEMSDPCLRLNDFWELKLVRQSNEDILRSAKFHIRKQKYKEICNTGDYLQALKFLQNNVSEVVNNSDENESKEFRELTQFLFNIQKTTNSSNIKIDKKIPQNTNAIPNKIYKERTELYEFLLKYFPSSMKEPLENLVDLVPI
jgi:N-acetylneuraminic acid mutarotase